MEPKKVEIKVNTGFHYDDRSNVLEGDRIQLRDRNGKFYGTVVWYKGFWHIKRDFVFGSDSEYNRYRHGWGGVKKYGNYNDDMVEAMNSFNSYFKNPLRNNESNEEAIVYFADKYNVSELELRGKIKEKNSE